MGGGPPPPPPITPRSHTSCPPATPTNAPSSALIAGSWRPQAPAQWPSSSSSPPRRRRQRPRRPVKAAVVNGTLVVSGTPSVDRIALRLSRTHPNRLQVDVGDNGSADREFSLGLLHSHQRRGRRWQRPDPDRHHQRRLHERKADAGPRPGRRRHPHRRRRQRDIRRRPRQRRRRRQRGVTTRRPSAAAATRSPGTRAMAGTPSGAAAAPTPSSSPGQTTTN